MDKLRFPLALFLSFLILFGWSAMQKRPQPETGNVERSEQAIDSASTLERPQGEAAAAPEVALPPPVGPVEEAAELWTEWVELGQSGVPGHYWARFTNRGGCLAELRLDGYYIAGQLSDEQKADRDNWIPLVEPIDTEGGQTGSFALRSRPSSQILERGPLEKALWKHELLHDSSGGVDGVRFTLRPGSGATLTKTIRSIPGTYSLDFELELSNEQQELAGIRQFTLTPAACVPQASTDSFYVEPQAVSVWSSEGELEIDSVKRVERGKEDSGSLGGGGQISFAGVHNKYFAMLLRGADDLSKSTLLGTGYRRVHDVIAAAANPTQPKAQYDYMVTDLELALQVPAPGQPATHYQYRVYAGPKDREIIRADYPDHARLTDGDLGFFTSIASILLTILSFFHGLTGNWGWAIILLTLTVRGALFPVNRRSQTAMAKHQTKMKRVQPRLDEVKQKYAKNAQKMRQEQARIMQEEGVMPPLGGCLPVFVQIPIFFGLFQSLRTSFDMRQAPFMGWIQDLSAPDRLARINLDTHLPFIGTIEYLNVLPPLMVVLWVMQQKVMPKPTEEQALRMQKMMVWMPVLFGFFLYNYAAGLSLYMITTSLFGILEQTVIKRVWPLDTAEKQGKKSGFMAKMMQLSDQAQKMQEAQKRQKLKAPGKGGDKDKRGKPR